MGSSSPASSLPLQPTRLKAFQLPLLPHCYDGILAETSLVFCSGLYLDSLLTWLIGMWLSLLMVTTPAPVLSP